MPTGGAAAPEHSGAAGLTEPKVLSVSLLKVAQASSAGGTAAFSRRISTLTSDTTQNLVVRLETVTDALVLWALHLELDKRDVPPCLRWPANVGGNGGQLEFITFLADLLWICRHNPGHITKFKGWRGIFKHTPDSSDWHAVAHRQYVWTAARYSLAHQCAKGLALDEKQRGSLMVLQTNAMRGDRHQLRPEEFETIRERLLSHCLDKPDRSGEVTPQVSAERRAKLWRVYLLSGRNQTATAKNWQLLSGEGVTRQAIAKQIEIVAGVLGVKA